MSRLPVHPRLARLVVEGQARGAGAAAGLAATLISERDIRQTARASFGGGPAGLASDRGADVLDVVNLFQQAAAERFRPDVLRRLELDRRATEEVDRARRQLGGGAGADRGGPGGDDALRMAILAAFPDRVARRREPRGRAVVLAAGGSAELGYEAAGDWLVAVDAEERTHARGGIKNARTGVVEVRLGSVIEPEWLLELFPDRVEDVDRRAFDPRTNRVERTTGLRYGALMLDETNAPAPSTTRPRACSPTRCSPAGRSDSRAARHFRRCCSGWPSCGGRCPRRRFRRWTRAAWRRWCARPAWAAAASPSSAIRRRWCWGAAARRPQRALALRTVAPNGSRSRAGAACRSTTTSAIRPQSNRACRISSARARCPRSAPGRVALTVHLLAPNGRAVQVTRDLENFWAQHYPALRRQLSRRYPRHAWPEDAATAKPPPLRLPGGSPR